MKTWDKKEKIYKYSPKYDGINVSKKYGTKLLTRGQKVVQVPEDFFGPSERKIAVGAEGELYCPDHPASQVSACIAADDWDSLRVVWFDHYDEPDIPCIDVQPAETTITEEVLIAELAGLDAKHIEGFVLMNGAGEKLKWKLERTATLMVTAADLGFAPRNIGLVCKLHCKDSTGRVVAAVAGFDRADQEHLTNLYFDGELQGTIIEVKFQYVGANGKLRHPRFLHFRPDVGPDCLNNVREV